ncbi:acetyl-CoA carboxylase, biotin carboxylase [Desulfurobacterium thermolithotrophum DSM 11699]|uniref:Biotin carboxylase n=1 Tax=Desulfurobacterium thermolithotrophum (strain DSM 11699 / BSA) TaxID=868864 RepID=F0S0I6_DESTD|nr:acetyl-CoA carboxylase biotin carboxylase subunit [Desulfurobacterium thermolithotrophum]ADY72714.1 acetyl-CoA carboxylase, biotin carboxylase [Desulfurobacterium thermolithotrophum DSM 11699]
MFKKVLIANRGEIAVRIIRTCRELGIKTVAIYSTADRDSLHVFLADEAVCIGGPRPQESYLNIPSIISAAEITGADAIHPGYGFLSENPGFAEICTACGMKFIGPSPETMVLMGDKAKAREVAIKAGVPVVPGSGIIKNVQEALKVCEEIGYPVLVKAAHGGGGRGMRLITSSKEAKTLIVTAMAEAEAAFGSGEVYIEKYIKNPRHIEIQVVADQFGNVVTFGERECSLQRRHQKVLEEAPSPFVDEDLRNKLSDAAKKIAEFINYEGAGTVEFLVDKDKNFYFIEMNTRIQVEHPVTEFVTEKDLIAKQIMAAAGEKLNISDVKLKGHAIEFRITCEDYEKDFRPTPGKIEKLLIPGGFGVRVDTHIYEGYKVPQYYDSLLAKLIVWGETREEAIKRGERALSEFVIEGNLKTTIPFHLKLLKDENFIKGALDTKILENKILPKLKR